MFVRTLACLFFIALISLLPACPKHDDKLSSSGPNASASNVGAEGASVADKMLPEVTSAAIVIDRPYADRDLGVQYTGHERGAGPITYRFRWFVDNALVQDGSNSMLSSGVQRKGSVVRVEVIPSNASGTGAAFISQPITIVNKPPIITSIVLTPIPAFAGAIINTVVNGKDIDGDVISYSYRWKVNGELVSGESSNFFNTQRLHKKDVISVVVTPSDGESYGDPYEAKTTLLNASPEITSFAPSEYAHGVYTYQVTAKDADGNSLTYRLLTSPPGMTIDPSTGLLRWEVPAGISKEVPVKIAVDDGDGGIAYQEFSLFLEKK